MTTVYPDEVRSEDLARLGWVVVTVNSHRAATRLTVKVTPASPSYRNEQNLNDLSRYYLVPNYLADWARGTTGIHVRKKIPPVLKQRRLIAGHLVRRT